MILTDEIPVLNKNLENKSPREILEWTVAEFGDDLAMSSSFQTQSMPLLHLVTRVKNDLRIFFLETGYHFWETLIFCARVASDWNLNVIDLHRDTRWDVFVRQNLRNLPQDDPNLCCYINKVQPMQKAVIGLKAWMTGIRRDQTAERAHAQILELENDGLIKVNPLLNWTKADVTRYIEENHLPGHPLLEKGYRSIGCAPCTVAVSASDPDRAGRWVGRGKTECGLHTDLFRQKEWVIR